MELITNECGRIAGLRIVFRSEGNLFFLLFLIFLIILGNYVMAPHKVSEMDRVEKVIRFGDTEEVCFCYIYYLKGMLKVFGEEVF